MKPFFLHLALLLAIPIAVSAQRHRADWNIGIGILTTKSVFENIHVNDNIYWKLRRFGSGFELLSQLSFSSRINFQLGFEASNIKLSYLYYGISHQTAACMPKFALRVNYAIRHTDAVRHEIGLGLLNYLDYWAEGIYYNTGGTELPERSIVDKHPGGWHPLIDIRYAFSWRGMGHRWKQAAFYFNKGFNPITTVTFNRITPPVQSSSFVFRGTYWGFEYVFFLRKPGNSRK